jgi:hypothetical protein
MYSSHRGNPLRGRNNIKLLKANKLTIKLINSHENRGKMKRYFFLEVGLTSNIAGAN